MLRTRLLRTFTDSLIVTSVQNHVCKVKLNKPKALNSLCVPMIELLQKELEVWNKDQNVRVVLFSADGAKAFCAGGDVRALYDAKKEGNKKLLSEFFHKEYLLDYCLSRMRPVQVSIYDGIVMGGGVGISIHSPIKIATEASVFAMPEAAIGLYPDVGGTYFLPRLPGNLGLYLSLTGGRFTGKELVQAGIATHFVPKEKLEPLKQALINQVEPNSSIQAIESIVDNFSADASGAISEIQSIEKYFKNLKSVEELYSRLSDNEPWSTAKLKSMDKLCPLTQKVAFEQNRRGPSLSLAEVFKLEYRISVNFMNGQEFFEGVRAVLIDKDKNPIWAHKTLADVSNDLVQSYFEPPSSNFVDLDVEAELQKQLRQ